MQPSPLEELFTARRVQPVPSRPVAQVHPLFEKKQPSVRSGELPVLVCPHAAGTIALALSEIVELIDVTWSCPAFRSLARPGRSLPEFRCDFYQCPSALRHREFRWRPPRPAARRLACGGAVPLSTVAWTCAAAARDCWGGASRNRPDLAAHRCRSLSALLTVQST